MKKEKLSIIIPVFNERGTISELLDKVEAVNLGVGIEKEIIIIDDFSTDGTREILKTMEDKFVILYHDRNYGKGMALRTGIKEITGDYVVVQDADLEYDPQEYSKLIEALGDGKTRVVYGSRFSGNYEDMSNLHYWGNKFLTLVTNVLYGVLLTDMETCYKCFTKEALNKILPTLGANRFDIEPEITATVSKAKLRIIELPISYSRRSYADGKKIGWKDGIQAIWTIIKYGLR